MSFAKFMIYYMVLGRADGIVDMWQEKQLKNGKDPNILVRLLQALLSAAYIYFVKIGFERASEASYYEDTYNMAMHDTITGEQSKVNFLSEEYRTFACITFLKCLQNIWETLFPYVLGDEDHDTKLTKKIYNRFIVVKPLVSIIIVVTFSGIVGSNFSLSVSKMVE